MPHFILSLHSYILHNAFATFKMSLKDTPMDRDRQFVVSSVSWAEVQFLFAYILVIK